MKKILFPLSLFLIGAVWSGCHSQAEEKEPETTFTSTSPIVVDTSLSKEYVSQIQSVRNIEIRAQEKGYLEKIYVDEGQYVKAGQVLFRISQSLYQADLLKAQAEARSAAIELQNAKLLADKEIVSKNEQAMAQAKLDAARAETMSAKAHLSYTTIRAPFDGVIDRIPLKLGSLIDEGALLTKLSDNNQMFAYFNVSEPEYLNYRLNSAKEEPKKVNLILANNQSLPVQGIVETVEGEFDNETGNIAFRARFPNPDRLLKNGETGKIKMDSRVANALIIPQKSTYELQDKIYVFVVDKNNTLHSRNITVMAEMPDVYIVGTGLTPTDKILLDGVQKAKDNEKIKCTYIKPEEAFSQLKLKSE